MTRESLKADAIYNFVEAHYGEPVDHVGMDDPIRELIAAAVQAETDRCANVEPGMDTSNVLGWDTMTPDERRMWKAGYSCAIGDFVAAIRARRNGAGRE